MAFMKWEAIYNAEEYITSLHSKNAKYFENEPVLNALTAKNCLYALIPQKIFTRANLNNPAQVYVL